MSEKKLDGDVLVDIVHDVEELNAKEAEIKDAKKPVFARAKDNGFSPKTLRRYIRHRAQDPEKRQRDDEEFASYQQLFEGSSRARVTGSSDTKDLEDAAPAEQPVSPVEGDARDKADPPPPDKPKSGDGAEVGGDAELLDIPLNMRRAANGEAPAPVTTNQQNDEGDPDPFNWQGNDPPEPHAENEAMK